MKKFFRYSALLVAGGLMFAGCKKFLNINHDPNNPLSVPESITLAPVEITLGTNVVGGFNGTTLNYWMQVLSLNQSLPTIENYFIQPTDVNNTWSFFVYPNILQNVKGMIQEAEAAHHNQYAAIGFAIDAYTLAQTTDLFGDIPWSQALQLPAIVKPIYDPQQSIYGDVQMMLDSALYYIGQPASAIAPGGDDYLYGGNMAAWAKWVHMMKARYYLRLSNAPGRNAVTQADSALAELASAQAFGSNADNAALAYPTSDGSPWYENTDPAAGGVVMAQSFINLLQNSNDPRLPILCTPASQGPDSGLYVGRPSGSDTVYGSYLDFSLVNTTYAGINAPLYFATYSEQLFIQAEATLITTSATAADPIYRAAIGAHLNMVGVTTADSAAYVSSLPLLGTLANPLQAIITQKYIAGFLGIEPYNDYRRTGYPALTIAQNALTSYIPKRWPYPTNEILANPQPQDSATLGSPVWWAQ